MTHSKLLTGQIHKNLFFFTQLLFTIPTEISLLGEKLSSNWTLNTNFDLYLFASFKTIPFRGGPPESLPDPGPWSVTSLTVHSFLSLLASDAGLANGLHIGLPTDEADGDAGIDEAGVGRGVGSLRELKSVSESGNVLSGHGGTGGQISSSFIDLSSLSVDEDLRWGSFESDNDRWNLSTKGSVPEVDEFVTDGDNMELEA